MKTEFKRIIITDKPGDMLDRQEYQGLRSSIYRGCLHPFCREINIEIPRLILARRNHGDLTREPKTSSSYMHMTQNLRKNNFVFSERKEMLLQ
jgi:hypothetical protein